MTHKVCPIDFENAEATLGNAHALLGHLAAKLAVSRQQRDLSDSTALRSVGPALAHALIACRSCLRGLGRVVASESVLSADLDHAWEVLAEPVQTVMRRYGIADAYDRLKEITRGHGIDRDRLHAFIRELDIPAAERERLLALTPRDYIGAAANLAADI